MTTGLAVSSRKREEIIACERVKTFQRQIKRGRASITAVTRRTGTGSSITGYRYRYFDGHSDIPDT